MINATIRRMMAEQTAEPTTTKEWTWDGSNT